MLEWMFFRAIMVAFFILANSFFVAAEFALISVRETRMEQLLALGRPGARTALQLKRSIDEFLPAVQADNISSRTAGERSASPPGSQRKCGAPMGTTKQRAENGLKHCRTPFHTL